MFFDSISIIAAAAAVFILRKREAQQGIVDGIFRMRGYPWLPIFYVCIYLGVTASVMISDPGIFATGLILFIFGFPLYHVIQFALNQKK